MGIIV